MNGEKKHWTAIGLVISALATISFGAIALTGLAGGTGGDLAVTSTPWLSNLLLAGGAVLLLGLELARSRRHRPVPIRRAMPVNEPVDGIAA
jgi:hypothetical protein